MKPLIINITLLFVIAPLVTIALAQQRSGKKMQKQMYQREFNTSTIETIEGQVTDITYRKSKAKSDWMGVHMTVKTENESIPVHLGPAWYINQQEKIQKGDTVTVVGSRITFEDKPALIASQIKRNQMTLKLRDNDGFPVWRGSRKNKQ